MELRRTIPSVEQSYFLNRADWVRHHRSRTAPQRTAFPSPPNHSTGQFVQPWAVDAEQIPSIRLAAFQPLKRAGCISSCQSWPGSYSSR